ncbi:ABC transporter permease [Clostridium sp.]|uniref:ABC transporter permease n=1 Tax=Clostridium sp. TaxID=1506 RepID=UPI003991D5AD
MNSMTWIVFKKEMSDLFRDRKSFLSAVVLPIILIPAIMFIIGTALSRNQQDVTSKLNIAIVGEQNTGLESMLKANPNVNIIPVKNPQEALNNEEIYLYIDIPNNFESTVNSQEGSSKIKIYFDNTSQKSSIAMGSIENLINEYNTEVVSKRLKNMGVKDSMLKPVTIESMGIGAQNEAAAKSIQMISMLLPMFVLIYAAQGGIAAATDLGAGEKERGSLEPLLSTRASRSSILIGKLGAITVMGILSTISGLAGVIIAFFVPNSMMRLNGGMALEWGAVGVIAILSILITLSFSALQLAISVYAKSFKEAQTYLGFVLFAPMIISYVSMAIDTKGAASILFNIPIFNDVLLMKEVIVGIYNPVHMALTFGWSIVYIVLAVLLARYMFNKESVLFRS